MKLDFWKKETNGECIAQKVWIKVCTAWKNKNLAVYHFSKWADTWHKPLTLWSSSRWQNIQLKNGLFSCFVDLTVQLSTLLQQKSAALGRSARRDFLFTLFSVSPPAREAKVPLYVVPVSAAQVSHHRWRAAIPSPQLHPRQSAGWYCAQFSLPDATTET